MVIPKGVRNSAPSPCANASGSAPNSAASVVIIIGRKRSKQAWKMACCGLKPCSRSAASAKSTIMMAFFFTMPISSKIPIKAMMSNWLLNIINASKAPTPAEGSVERMVTGCTRLSYSIPNTKYTASKAKAISTGWLDSDCWKVCAVPLKPPTIALGRPTCETACSISAVISDKAMPGCKLNDKVAAVKPLWRFTDKALAAGFQLANADKGMASP